MMGLPYLFCKPLKGMHGGTAIVHKRRSIVHLCTKYRMHKIKVLQVTCVTVRLTASVTFALVIFTNISFQKIHLYLFVKKLNFHMHQLYNLRWQRRNNLAFCLPGFCRCRFQNERAVEKLPWMRCCSGLVLQSVPWQKQRTLWVASCWPASSGRGPSNNSGQRSQSPLRRRMISRRSAPRLRQLMTRF